MKAKITLLCIYMLSISLLTACFDATELDELAIALLIGIDLEDDKILITAEVINLQYSSDSSSSGNVSVKYVQGTGNTVLEALRDITLKFGHRIYGAHTKAIIFGEDLAKKGVMPYMDQLFRARELRESAYVLVAKEAKAYEVMGVSSGLEPIPANYIISLIDSIRYNPKTIDTNMMDFVKHYYHMGRHPIVAILEKRQKKGINQTEKEVGTKDFELSSIGSAVFKNDTLVGYLSGNDTKALNYILNNVKGGIITFPTPVDSDETLFSSLSTIKVRTKNDVDFKDGRLILKTKITISGNLGEIGGDMDISNYESLEKMAQACSQTVKEGIEMTVKKVQREFGFDIFGFGHVLHKKHTEEWRKIEGKWDDLFAEADFQIEVVTNIISSGLLNKPLTVKEK
ncbi:MAG: Ger(x)C family spore germination protein [Tissierellia bacterium]|nr:Ger(x)C family spore germination protein [Tissierellia bacterium]